MSSVPKVVNMNTSLYLKPHQIASHASMAPQNQMNTITNVAANKNLFPPAGGTNNLGSVATIAPSAPGSASSITAGVPGQNLNQSTNLNNATIKPSHPYQLSTSGVRLSSIGYPHAPGPAGGYAPAANLLQTPGRLRVFIADIGHASLERFLRSENISIILNTAGGERDKHLPKLGLDYDWVSWYKERCGIDAYYGIQMPDQRGVDLVVNSGGGANQ